MKVPATDKEWEFRLEEAVSAIDNNNCFLFSANQDAASVGSLLALALYLIHLGKKVFLLLPDPIASSYDYLDKIIQYNYLRVLDSEEDINLIKDQVEAIIFFDTPNPSQIPFFSCINENILSRDPSVIEIDHHFGNDSREIFPDEIKLFRQVDATAEIVTDLLLKIFKKHSVLPDPLKQRNILLSLATGWLGDTASGKSIHNKQEHDRWMELFRKNLAEVTYDGYVSEENKIKKIRSPEDILDYFDMVSRAHEACFKFQNKEIVNEEGVGFLNLLNSTYENCKDVCPTYDSQSFAEVRDNLLNKVPEYSGKVGILCFHGKTVAGESCMLLKIRRSSQYEGFDLRNVENEIRNIFGVQHYIGGGGHPGAVSFYLKPLEEKKFLNKVEKVSQYLKDQIR